MGEVSQRLNAGGVAIEQCPIAASELGDLIRRVAAGQLHRGQAKQLFEALWPETIELSLSGVETTARAGRVEALVRQFGFDQSVDTGELERIVDGVVAANAKSVEEYRAGKEKAFNALVGQVMKASKGKANPAQVNELLKRKLG
jgi:aspartyl-tRNA(Asn)/glutamyl-tRNA(Gln) amidotransferase subunit B